MLIRKTVVGSRVIDRVTAKLGRKRYEVPVVFKWFVDGSVLTTEKRRQQLEAVQMAFEITGVQP